MILLLLLPCVYAVVHSTSDEWALLESHPMEVKAVTNDELKDIVYEVWDDLSCDIKYRPTIEIFFDYDITGTTTLAWASQMLTVRNNVWIPTLVTDYSGVDFMLGVNPSPPNGWHTDPSCDDIGWRYDLRTVLRHEIMHGMAIASSITDEWTVGMYYGNRCYPRLYDTMIKDENGPIVEGCTVRPSQGKKLYVGGVEIYNPYAYQQGSSFSHHDHPQHLMYYQIPSRQCLHLGPYEHRLLKAVNITCRTADSVSSAMYVKPSWVLILLYILVGIYNGRLLR